MVKKVLLIAGAIFLGLNFGMISGFMPILLIVGFVLFQDGLKSTVLAGYSTLTAIVAGILTYVHMYRKKREHESPSPYVMALAWSFVAGAVIAAVALFIYSGNEIYRI